MAQEQQADDLIRCLLAERKEYQDIGVASKLPDKRRLLRSLMNVRPTGPGQRGVSACAGRLSARASCPAGRHRIEGPDAGAARPVSLAG